MLKTIQKVFKGGAKELRRHWIIYSVVSFLCFWLFMHDDVMETSNHTYLFLESVFSGRLLHFYQDTQLHQNSFYYTNSAHYNVVVYLIFGIFELPYFAVTKIFGLAPVEEILRFNGKFVGMVFLVGCIIMFKKVAEEFGLSKKDSELSALVFALSAPVMLSVTIMGQYDSLCLFFTLIAIYYWLKGKYTHFAFWIGVGAACKFFPLFLMIPLILFVEKRPLHVIKYGAISLWLIAPTTLIFLGRTGNMAAFTDAMVSRLFAARWLFATETSVLPLIYAVICIVAWMWNAEESRRKSIGMWLCLASFGLVFMFSYWHPQWIILLVPFMVLTTFGEKSRSAWFWVDIVFGVGFFLYCALVFQGQLEANLFRFGILEAFGIGLTSPFNTLTFYYLKLPMISVMHMILFGAALVAHVALKVPLKNGTPASRLASTGGRVKEGQIPLYAWLSFSVPFLVWLLPVLFTFSKAIVFF